MTMGTSWATNTWATNAWATGSWADVGGASDTTPDAFSFADRTNVAQSTPIISAAITVSGIDAASPITVIGGTYDINLSGSFTSSAGIVNNGDLVRAAHTSSASLSTAVNTTVTIGGVSDIFTSTTASSPVIATSNTHFRRRRR